MVHPLHPLPFIMENPDNGKLVWNIPARDAIEIRIIRAKIQSDVWV